MPKVKVIPTEAQARYMRQFTNNSGILLLWTGRGPGHWFGIGSKTAHEQVGKPPARTMKVLTREGWMEYADGSKIYYRPSEDGIAALVAFDGGRVVDVRQAKPIYSEQDLVRAIVKKWGRDWHIATQVRLRDYRDRYVDAMAILHARGPALVRAFEIKTNRSDFLRELDNPEKRRPITELANDYYFVAPIGVAAVDELPDETGLAEVGRNGRITIMKQAPTTRAEPPTWELLTEFCKRLESK